MRPPALRCFIFLPFSPPSHLRNPLPSLFHCLRLQLQEQSFCPLIFNYKDQTLDVDFVQFKDHNRSLSITPNYIHSNTLIRTFIHYIHSNTFIRTFIPYIHHVYLQPLTFLAFFRIRYTIFPISQSFQSQSFGQTKAYLDTGQQLWRY